MKIQEKDLYYGVALRQIVDHPTPASVNKIRGKDGLYQINEDKRILIKYSKSDFGEWRFSIRKDDFEDIYSCEFFLVLVCARDTICLLSYDDIKKIVDIDEPLQWISVSYPDGGQMRVKGSQGNLPHTVAHNAFPKNLLWDLAPNHRNNRLNSLQQAYC